MDAPGVSPPHSPHGGTLGLGTPVPTLQPLSSRPSLTFNLLRCKLDLKGDPKESECLAQRVDPGLLPGASSRNPGLSLVAAPTCPHSSTQCLLPSTLTPSCLLPLPDLLERGPWVCTCPDPRWPAGRVRGRGEKAGLRPQLSIGLACHRWPRAEASEATRSDQTGFALTPSRPGAQRAGPSR